MADSEWITPDGVVLSRGNGIKRKNNKAIWRLWDMGYRKCEISVALSLHRNTTYRHIEVYGRLRAT